MFFTLNIFQGCAQQRPPTPGVSPRWESDSASAQYKVQRMGLTTTDTFAVEKFPKDSTVTPNGTDTGNIGAMFDRLMLKFGRTCDDYLEEDELDAVGSLLRAQGAPADSLAFSLQWAHLGRVGRSAWVQHFSTLQFSQAVLQDFLVAIDKLDAQAVQAKLHRSRDIDAQKPVNGCNAQSAIIEDNSTFISLPPGFKIVPSSEDPSQLRFYDPIANVKYKSVEHAWEVHNLRQKSLAPSESTIIAKLRKQFRECLEPGASVGRGARSISTNSLSHDKVVPEVGSDGKFLDVSFRPSREALGIPRPGRSFINEEQIAAVKWIRLPELLRMSQHVAQDCPIVLWDMVRPQDLTQGKIGNCWLVASIAALAEFPSAVQSLFEEVDIDRGRYVIRLYDMGKAVWERVVVDDYVPCLYEEDWSDIPYTTTEEGVRHYSYQHACNPDGSSKIPHRWMPIFGKPKNQSLWGPLLEKAMAKFVGSYAWVAGGAEPYALTAFTGMPLVYCFVRPSLDESDTAASLGEWEWCGAQYICRDRTGMNYTPISKDAPNLSDDELWQKTLSYDARNYVMTAAITKYTPPETTLGFFRKDGLVLGHAYSLISYQMVTLETGSPSQRAWVNWFDNDGDNVGFMRAEGRMWAMCNAECFAPNGEAHITQLEICELTETFSAQDSKGACFSGYCPREKHAELWRLWGGIEPLRLVMLRNPHGEGERNAQGQSSTEWNGNWCNGSRLWDELPEVARQVNYQPMGDGIFWMSWSDFRSRFDKICVLAKSMEDPRGAFAFQKRAERQQQVCMALSAMAKEVANSGMMKDLRQVSLAFDPFCQLPTFLDDGTIETRLKWEASKPGNLQAFMDLNKSSGNQVGYDYFLEKIYELGLEQALGPNGYLQQA